jgi:thiol-disulfide isomerase/thioredoxin
MIYKAGMKSAFFTLVFTVLFVFAMHAQAPGYSIRIELQGYHDTLAYLGHYHGDKLSVADTARAENEKIIFEGDEPLPQGVYFLVSAGKQKIIEFLIDDQQNFSIRTDMRDPAGMAMIGGSDENSLFFAYLNHNKQSYENLKALQKLRSGLEDNPDSLALINHQIDSINRESVSYKLRLMEEHPESITALLFRIMREPVLSDFFEENGRQDTLSAYLYFRQHYWDGIDFSDDRYLRTPVFHRKLSRYMEEVIPKHPDSVIRIIDAMIMETNGNEVMRDYLLWYFTGTYEASNVMGYDRVFVHMVDRYFTGQAYEWLHPGVQKNMTDRADQLRNLLIGNYAPPLLLADTNNQITSLHQISAEYLIILFWSVDCGECKREVNILNDFCQNSDLDIRVYAINTDTTLIKWKEYIRENRLDWIHVNGNISLSGDYHVLYDIYSTPVIYVLDEQKRIIAKRLSAEQIAGFLKHDKKMKTN